MVNGNEKYLQDLYDHVETIQSGWEVEEHLRKLSESRQETFQTQPYTESYQFVNGSLQRVGG
jgi:hypothetical protein